VGDEGFFNLGRGITWDCFHMRGKYERLKEELKMTRMKGKMTGRLSRIRRRLMLSGPAELETLLRKAPSRISGVI
jgi:hypothetical protein